MSADRDKHSVGEHVVSKTDAKDRFAEIPPLHFQVEPVSMKEFYTRLGISRTKAFEMKREGTLVKGRHYMQFGRKIIFLWGPHLLSQLLEGSCEKTKELSEVTACSCNVEEVNYWKKRSHKLTVIDINYCLKE